MMVTNETVQKHGQFIGHVMQILCDFFSIDLKVKMLIT